jgi:nitroreductase
MTTKDALTWRYATKLFDAGKKVSDADMQDLTDSLHYSPSSFGLQPWHFLIVKDTAIREKLRPISWDQSQITDCSHLFVLCARTNMDEEYIERFVSDIVEKRGVAPETVEGYKQMMLTNVLGKSEEERTIWMQKQIYIALGFLMSACMNKRIDSCPMEGFDKEKYDEILGLTEKGLTAVVLCPVGYRSEEDAYATLPKVRWDKDAIVENRPS